MGEGSVQDEAQGSGQGRDSRAAMILDQAEGADLGKMPKPVGLGGCGVPRGHPEGDSQGARLLDFLCLRDRQRKA